MTITVITITLNEEHNIAPCLDSVLWANEIIVVDGHSIDRTVELAGMYRSKVFQRDWEGYAKAKTFALSQATSDWVFWLDADERVTPGLADEVRKIVAAGQVECAGFEVARRAYFLGKWIKHCGWYPGHVVRLFRRDAVRFSAKHVHESVECDGKIGRLSNDLLHYTDDNLFHYYAKFNRYTSLAAKDLGIAGSTFKMYDLLIRPPFLFVKMYLLRLGFLDGMHGLILSLLSSAYVFTKYAKMWEREGPTGPA